MEGEDEVEESIKEEITLEAEENLTFTLKEVKVIITF